MGSGLLTFAVIAVVVALFVGSYLASQRRAPVERGQVPVYEQMCSGRIGLFMGANYPVIRFSMYDTFLVVGFFRVVVVPYQDIVRAEVQSSFPMRRLAIKSKSGASFRLAVKEPEQVLKLLRRT